MGVRFILLVFALCQSLQFLTVNAQYSGKITFAHLADLHVSPGSPAEAALSLVVDDLNRRDVDFVIINGDLTNTGSVAELDAVRRALGRLEKEYYILPGNHETNWSETAGLYFNSLWGSDRFIFRKAGFVFAGFNTGPFMRMGDGLVKREDLDWLGSSLKREIEKGDRLIAFAHYPLAEGLSNWPEITGILKSNGCVLCFCGHGHKLSLLNFDGITGIMGRALQIPGSGPGYNIVSIRGDSLFVSNAVPGIAESAPLISIDYPGSNTLRDIPVSARPDFSVNDKYLSRLAVTETGCEASVFTGPCLAGDSLVVTGDSEGRLRAADMKTGKVKWERSFAAPLYSTPVEHRGIIAFGTVDGHINGLRSDNGKTMWTVDTGRPVLAEGIAENGYLYIGGGDRDFLKIDIESGKTYWKFSGVEGLIQGKPALSDSIVVFGAWDRHLYALGRNDGKLKWKWNNGKPQQLYSPGNITPVIAEGRVFIVAPDRFMTALDLADGSVIWRSGRHTVRESMGKSSDGKLVFAKLMNDTVVAVSSVSGHPLTVWAVSQGFGYEHNPCPVLSSGDVIFTGSRAGVITAADSKTGKVLWKYKAGVSSVSGMAADATGTLWFTLAEGKTGSIRVRAGHSH